MRPFIFSKVFGPVEKLFHLLTTGPFRGSWRCWGLSLQLAMAKDQLMLKARNSPPLKRNNLTTSTQPYEYWRETVSTVDPAVVLGLDSHAIPAADEADSQSQTPEQLASTVIRLWNAYVTHESVILHHIVILSMIFWLTIMSHKTEFLAIRWGVGVVKMLHTVSTATTWVTCSAAYLDARLYRNPIGWSRFRILQLGSTASKQKLLC
jgi:hypothetical protein